MLGLILYLEEKDQTFQPQSSQEQDEVLESVVYQHILMTFV